MKKITRYGLQLVKESTHIYDVEDNVKSPRDAFDAVTQVFKLSEAAEEQMVMLTLDIKCKCTGAFLVSQGSLNASIVHPREIFKRALLNNAASIVLAHNHPSGDPEPSSEDVNITARLKEAGHVIGIELVDHIVVGDRNRFVSMKERGLF